MVRFGIQAPHEQFNPTDLLNDVIMMERYGIEKCWSSDHYMPWWHTGASGGAAWPWLGAALAKTDRIVVGTGVTAPFLRYNPAVVAQVFATLGYMFPGRVFLGLGRGESLNEVPAGTSWPSNQERFERLEEAIKLIKLLWMEDWVTFNGKYYRVKDSNLYTKPLQPIPIFVAGIGPQSARLAGREADGFVTNEANPDLIENKLLPAFKDGAMKAGRNPEALDKVLFLPASYDPDKQKALESIAYWRGAMVKAFFEVNFPDPRKIEESAQVVGMDTMEKMALVVSSAEEAMKKLDKYVRLGFTEIVLINSSPNRETFIKLLSQEIAPALIDPNKPTTNAACYYHHLLLTSAPLEIPNCSTYYCCNDSTDSSKHRYSWCASRFGCYASSGICGSSLVFLLNVNITYRCLRCRVGLLVWYSLCLPLCFLKTAVLPSLLFLCRLLLLCVVYILCVSTSNSNSTYQNNNCKQLQHPASYCSTNNLCMFHQYRLPLSSITGLQKKS